MILNIFKNKKILLINSLIYVFLFLIFNKNINASTIYLKSNSKNIITTEVFKVDFLIDTNKNNINAFESNIFFDENFLNVEKVYTGNSIVDFWIKSPRHQGNKIFFSGIKPGGFIGENSKIISVLFSAKKSGQTSIDIENSLFLLNDDKGTEDYLIIKNLFLNIKEKDNIKNNHLDEDINTNIDVKENENSNLGEDIDTENDINEEVFIKDTTRPESFVVKIIKDDKLNKDNFSLIFYAQDKGSGISHYEIKEGEDDFIKVKDGPYVLKYQDLTKEIQVKAIDLEGNYRIEKIGPFIVKEKKSIISYKFIIISLLFIIFVLILLNTYLNRRKKNEKNNII